MAVQKRPSKVSILSLFSDSLSCGIWLHGGTSNYSCLTNFYSFISALSSKFDISTINIQPSAIWYLISILSSFTSWLNWDLYITKNVVKILVRFISALGFTRLIRLISKLVYYKTLITMMVLKFHTHFLPNFTDFFQAFLFTTQTIIWVEI